MKLIKYSFIIVIFIISQTFSFADTQANNSNISLSERQKILSAFQILDKDENATAIDPEKANSLKTLSSILRNVLSNDQFSVLGIPVTGKQALHPKVLDSIQAIISLIRSDLTDDEITGIIDRAGDCETPFEKIQDRMSIAENCGAVLDKLDSAIIEAIKDNRYYEALAEATEEADEEVDAKVLARIKAEVAQEVWEETADQRAELAKLEADIAKRREKIKKYEQSSSKMG